MTLVGSPRTAAATARHRSTSKPTQLPLASGAPKPVRPVFEPQISSPRALTSSSVPAAAAPASMVGGRERAEEYGFFHSYLFLSCPPVSGGRLSVPRGVAGAVPMAGEPRSVSGSFGESGLQWSSRNRRSRIRANRTDLRGSAGSAQSPCRLGQGQRQIVTHTMPKNWRASQESALRSAPPARRPLRPRPIVRSASLRRSATASQALARSMRPRVTASASTSEPEIATRSCKAASWNGVQPRTGAVSAGEAGCGLRDRHDARA